LFVASGKNEPDHSQQQHQQRDDGKDSAVVTRWRFGLRQ